jgi:hypothetical protein
MSVFPGATVRAFQLDVGVGSGLQRKHLRAFEGGEPVGLRVRMAFRYEARSRACGSCDCHAHWVCSPSEVPPPGPGPVVSFQSVRTLIGNTGSGLA